MVSLHPTDAAGDTGEVFLSAGRGNDGSFSKHYCGQEEAVPASLSTEASLAALMAADQQDGITGEGHSEHVVTLGSLRTPDYMSHL